MDTVADYEALIEKLEASSQRSPKWYLSKVLMLASLGFGYIGIALSVSVAIVAACVGVVFLMPNVATFKVAAVLGIPALVVVWGITGALRVKFDPPTGRKLEAAEFPYLFERIESIRKDLDGPRVHEVLLTDELNAAIVGVPRLGILGWYKNYLILGLPLMAALTPDEFDAVVGHEMGHLSGDHGRIGGWVYRVRKTWMQLAENINGESGSFVFRRFFNWYIPYFNAYSFVLARSHEYHADDAGAQVTSNETMGRALSRIEVVSEHLKEEFWPSIAEANREDDAPPADFFDAMRHSMQSSVGVEGSTTYLHNALGRRVGLSDTHPGLAQRLDALGVEATVPGPLHETAGERYLEGEFDRLLEVYSEHWYERVEGQWKLRHEELVRGAQRLEELDEIIESGESLDEELWEYAGLIEEQKGSDAVVPILQEMCDDITDEVELSLVEFHMGRILLEEPDPAGIEHLERAMDLNEHLTTAACEMIIGYHFEHGVRSDAQRWLDRVDVYQHKIAHARAERETLTASDTFVAPMIEPEVLEAFKEAVLPVFEGCKVYLVEKVVEYYPEEPFYILAIGRSVGPLTLSVKNLDERLQELELPIDAVVFDMTADEYVGHAIRKIKAARLDR